MAKASQVRPLEMREGGAQESERHCLLGCLPRIYDCLSRGI